MDSIDVYSFLDVVWTVLIGHMAIGFVWAHVPALSQLYVKTAAAYAAAAMENYSVALVSEAGLGDDHLRTCAELARQAVLRADFSLDYYANQRKHFANLLWVTELRWTFECLKSIERLDKSANEARKRATEEKSGA
ncbi:MAG: hypothetical protein WA194_05765 [Patescibacteria group bacterium]